nr:uncharacterized protein LOC121501930 [Drosophila kikkawai]
MTLPNGKRLIDSKLSQFNFNFQTELHPSFSQRIMKAIKIPVVLLLCLLLTEATDPEPQLEFLDKLFKIMNDQDTIETIIILQHRQDLNCPLQRWNSREIPVLRSNELSSFEVRRIMKKQLLVMVCIDGDSDHILLNALAKILENLRQQNDSFAQTEFVSPSSISSLLVVVPCLYGTFVLVESLVLVVTHRMYGESYRLTNLNPLLNLRAFRAILGLPFPDCKLTAMLTKPLPLAEVRNFEELRASGLTTITDEYIHSFIENNIDSQFFNQFLSSTGKMNHCTSKDLIIARNLPRMYVLESNSIFKWMLSRFVMYAQEAGITEHWNRFCFQFLIKAFNLTVQQNVGTRYVPLSLQQFNWLWHLLAIGYGIATVAFLVEIYLNKRRGVGQQKHPV